MKYFLFLTICIILSSCRITYVEIYNVEKYPVSFQDTIYYKQEHWHFKDRDDVWVCVDLDADTAVIDFQDTICVPIYQGTYKKKNHNFN
jgi:hypothetical protein